MTLRIRILLVIGLALAVLILLVLLAAWRLTQQIVAQGEDLKARRDIQRVQAVWSDRLDTLDEVVHDWASWDDTYAFVEDANAKYIESNLVDETFRHLHINIIVFVHSSGRVVFGRAFDPENNRELPLPDDLQTRLTENILPRSRAPAEKIAGVILLAEGPLLIAVRPILTSEEQGPGRGILMMGRYLDDAEVAHLAKLTQLDVQVYPIAQSALPTDVAAVLPVLSKTSPVAVRPLSEETLAGYALIEDINAQAVLVAQVKSPRSTYQLAQAGVRYYALTLVLVGSTILALILWQLDRHVLMRLAKTSAQVVSIGARSDFSERVAVGGHDELTHLAISINQMLAALQRSQDGLRASEERYRALVEASPDAITLVDLEGRVLMCNQQILRIHGFDSLEEVIGINAFEFVAPEDRQHAVDNARLMLQTGKINRYEYTLLKKDGTRFSAELNVSAVRDTQGQPAAFVGITRDITERKRLARDLQDERDFVLQIFETVGQGLTVTDAEGRFVRVNPAYAQLLGYAPQDLIGKHPADLTVPEDRAVLAQAHLDREQGKTTTYETRLRRKDGSYAHVLITGAPRFKDGKYAGAIAAITDVTALKQVEEALRLRIAELAALQAIVLDIAAPYDLPTLLQVIVERAGRLLNTAGGGLYLCDPAQQQLRCVVSLNTPHDYTGTVLRYGEGAAGTVAQTGQPLIIDDYRVWSGRAAVYEDQQPFTAVLSAPMIWHDQVIGVIDVLENVVERRFTQTDLELLTLFASHAAIAVHKIRQQEVVQRELTERKQAEEALRLSEARLRSLFDTMAEGVVLIAPDGAIIQANRAAEHILGFARSEILRRNYIAPDWKTVRPDGTPMPPEEMAGPRAMQERQAVKDVVMGFERPDGTISWINVSAAPLINENGVLEGVVGTFADISERKRAEAALQIYAAELERSNRALQEFAYVASHDLQEPLRKVQAFGDLLKAQYAPLLGEEGRDYVERMQSAATRMQDMINGLLTYSRVTTQARPLESVSLGQVAQEVLSDLEARIEQTSGRVELGELPTLDADPLQMRQLLQNLIGNALKFHRPGSAPVVKVYQTSPPCPSLPLRGTQAVLPGEGGGATPPPSQGGGGRVGIAVQDNGIGFDETHLDRLFQPFGRLHGRSEYEGSGMGLAICRKIVERHGGTITATSQPGVGSTFTVTLPARQTSRT